MGKLSFYYGVMGAGKSEELIKIYHNYERVGKKVLTFNFIEDLRDFNDNNSSVGIKVPEIKISSRVGVSIPAIPYDNETNFITQEELGASVFIIDEGQFLNKQQVIDLTVLADSGIDVLVFGLKNDFMNNLFDGSKALIEQADKLIEMKTLCAYCDKKAIMNARYIDGKQVFQGEQKLIGDEEYKGVCRNHWYEAV